MSDQAYSILDEASKQQGIIGEEEEARKRALMAAGLEHLQAGPLNDSSGQALAPMGRTEPTAAISPKAAQSITEPSAPTTQPASITGESAPKPASGRVYGDKDQIGLLDPEDELLRERKGTPVAPPASITETEKAAAPTEPATTAAPLTPQSTPATPAKPTESITGITSTPATPAASITAPPLEQMGPAGQREQDLLAHKPAYHGWKKGLDILGRFTGLGRNIEEATGLGTLGYQANLRRAEEAAKMEQAQAERPLEITKEKNILAGQQDIAQFNTPQKRQAYMAQNPNLFTGLSDFEKNDYVLSGKFPQREPVPPRTGNPEADAYYSLRDEGKNPQEALEIIKGAGKQDRPINSTPFEAFAYGTPEEKKAAQEFLEFEKKAGSRYRTPNEFDLRYKLYREDPETYKAMFGDKGEAAEERTHVTDRAHATKMLNFFQRQRDEISKNYTLSPEEQAQKIREIDELEKPFMDVVQPGAGGDRVKVVGPDGTPGTIPRSQLGAAKKKGYRVTP